MKWHLLDQFIVKPESLDTSTNLVVLESLLSSELQLVSLLMSGTVSHKTMTSLGHGTRHCLLGSGDQ